MSALVYFLNAGLNTPMSAYALQCLSQIDQAIKSNKVRTKLDRIEIDKIQLEMLFDLLEIYYFNERQVGILIDNYQVTILDLQDPPETISDSYEENRIIWYKHLKKMIDSTQDHPSLELMNLRRPRDLRSLDSETELYLADELSENIAKFGFQLIRGSAGRWLLRRLRPLEA